MKPRRVLGELLVKNLPHDEPDACSCAWSSIGGGKRLRYDIIDRYDPETGLSAMMRTTAFPASIVALMMARNQTTSKGALPQERCIPPDAFMDELAERKIDAGGEDHEPPHSLDPQHPGAAARGRKSSPDSCTTSWMSLAIAAAVLGLLTRSCGRFSSSSPCRSPSSPSGLFLLVLNAIMLELTAWLVPGFDIDGFGWAIVGALVLSIVSLVTDRIGRKRRGEALTAAPV